MAKSQPSDDFLLLWRMLGASRHAGLIYPEPERELRFHPRREWRFDFAWRDACVALEMEGGIFVGGGHTRGVHYSGDCEKYNHAQLLGWAVMRMTPLSLRPTAPKYTKRGTIAAGSNYNPVDFLELLAKFIARRIDEIPCAGVDSSGRNSDTLFPF